MCSSIQQPDQALQVAGLSSHMQRCLTNLQQMLLNNLYGAQSTRSQQQQHHAAGTQIALRPLFPLGASNTTCLTPPCMSCSAIRWDCSWCITLRYCILSAFCSILLSFSMTHSDMSKPKSISGIDASGLLRLLLGYPWALVLTQCKAHHLAYTHTGTEVTKELPRTVHT